MARNQEDVVDCKHRVNEEAANEMSGDEWPCVRLFDLRKAYPRVRNPELWMLLERYGINGDVWSACGPV